MSWLTADETGDPLTTIEVVVLAVLLGALAVGLVLLMLTPPRIV